MGGPGDRPESLDTRIHPGNVGSVAKSGSHLGALALLRFVAGFVTVGADTRAGFKGIRPRSEDKNEKEAVLTEAAPSIVRPGAALRFPGR